MSRPRYPFREMEIGEVRIVETAQKKFSHHAHRRGEILGRKFKTRRISEREVEIRRIA